LDNLIVYKDGKCLWKGKEYRCAIGKGGIAKDKKEGDGATPVGCFPIRKIFYRADRLKEPNTVFPTQPITKYDGWCDDSSDSNYNKHIKLPYKSTHEELWRDDNVYDVVAVLGYNDKQPVPGKGSAIFLHIARANYSPTAGCIALTQKDLLEIIESMHKDTSICVQL